jgi:hypothetical protein
LFNRFNKDNVILLGEDKALTILNGGIRYNFTKQINGLTYQNLGIYGSPITAGNNNWIHQAIERNGKSTYGVDNFVMNNCVIDGRSRNQMGFSVHGFGANLTITNSEFTNVGWGIFVSISFW